MSRFLTLGLMIAVMGLSACGRRGDIVPPDGKTEDPRIEDFRKIPPRDADGPERL
ncbi:hypothetical protein GCM10007972_13540 [Iodidimonas muriae]|uniref:Lipoprotein n=1 Tax=Iodidimonas muriae TaxID=261467 RepID=A0ABQ2LCK0_9PROT|nr:lipoprotein [Iodidimonas muriae]GER07420.1 hypothetical protein JCM17843_17300 [Kordiimonadales bacterium JCM 17843]GGO10581.1 hypothetical protein GCM10007972_13540 [Iodidimonas muriae]